VDKNISALLREDARTVHVSYYSTRQDKPDFGIDPAPAKHSTYVTHFPLVKGDKVVVMAGGQIMLAQVMHVDDEVKIDPNDTIRYAWVIAKVDMEAHEANMARNKAIEESVADAYRLSLRRSFSEQVLGNLSKTKRLEVAKLLKP
jgi:preprotein translocase subunit YajC